jgi:hypothetical protein
VRTRRSSAEEEEEEEGGRRLWSTIATPSSSPPAKASRRPTVARAAGTDDRLCGSTRVQTAVTVAKSEGRGPKHGRSGQIFLPMIQSPMHTPLAHFWFSLPPRTPVCPLDMMLDEVEGLARQWAWVNNNHHSQDRLTPGSQDSGPEHRQARNVSAMLLQWKGLARLKWTSVVENSHVNRLRRYDTSPFSRLPKNIPPLGRQTVAPASFTPG